MTDDPLNYATSTTAPAGASPWWWAPLIASGTVLAATLYFQPAVWGHDGYAHVAVVIILGSAPGLHLLAVAMPTLLFGVPLELHRARRLSPLVWAAILATLLASAGACASVCITWMRPGYGCWRAGRHEVAFPRPRWGRCPSLNTAARSAPSTPRRRACRGR